MDKSLEKCKNLMISLQINQRLFREVINELNEQNLKKQFELIISDNERVINELRITFRQEICGNNDNKDINVDSNDRPNKDIGSDAHKRCKQIVSTNERITQTNNKSTGSGVKQFVCQWPGCGYETQFMANINRHTCVHSGLKKYVCDWPHCAKRYRQSNSLLTHKRWHLGLKPFGCDWEGCDYTTNNRCSLPAHRRTHKGLKPFPCDKCQTSCSTITHLREHQLVHSKDKPFKCDVCLQCFSKNSNMKEHKRSVHFGVKRVRNKINSESESTLI